MTAAEFNAAVNAQIGELVAEGASRPDAMDEVNAFRAGFRHGQDRGSVSRQEAAIVLRGLPTTIPVCDVAITLFCHGADAGCRNDRLLYLFSFFARAEGKS